jgi:hypothetical protein
VACTLGAIGATPRRRNKLRVPPVEGRILQNEQDVRINLELQIADRQQDMRRFRASVVYLFEASGERLFLLVGRQFCQQQGMAHLGAISNRQEIAAAIPSYLPAVPQLYAEVDRDKAS